MSEQFDGRQGKLVSTSLKNVSACAVRSNPRARNAKLVDRECDALGLYGSPAAATGVQSDPVEVLLSAERCSCTVITLTLCTGLCQRVHNNGCCLQRDDGLHGAAH